MAPVPSRLPSPQVATTILAGARQAPVPARPAPPAKAVSAAASARTAAALSPTGRASLGGIATSVRGVGGGVALSLVPPAAQMPLRPGAPVAGLARPPAAEAAGPATLEPPQIAPPETPATAEAARAAPSPSALGGEGETATKGKAPAEEGRSGGDAQGKDAEGKAKGAAAEEGAAKEGAAKEGEAPERKKRSAREAIAPAAAGVRSRATGARAHSTSPSIPVGSAENAAISPATERARGAAAETVTKMDAAEADRVRRDAFKTALQTAITNATTPAPRTESAAERMMKQGASDASRALRGELTTQKDAAAGPMQTAAKTEVSPETQQVAPETSLAPEPMGKPPAPVAARSVVPEKLPPEQLDYSEDRAPTDKAMADAGVTTEQLEKGNEPAFGTAIEARSTAEKHEAKAEAQYRKTEAGVQAKAHGKAQAELAEGLGDMHGVRGEKVGSVVNQQTATQAKNAAERKRITDTITGIKTSTKALVDGILAAMDADAARIFEAGLKDAEAIYEQVFEDAKGGVGTWLTTWGDDWEELIESSLATARQAYLRRVDQAIDAVADSVDTKLKAAKDCVTAGRMQVDTFVKGLDASLLAFGKEAQDAVGADFDALEGEIDSRRDALIEKLVVQYKASFERMEAKEQELREANKSLWQRVYDATVGLIKKILAFKDMLLTVLAKAASVIGDIISDPIGFLGNLVDGVMLGLKNFMGNIGTHLKKGLMEWLFGALAGAGLQLPETFDLQGIVSIVLQVLGLTYANFRARAVAIVGEPVVAALEQAAEVFKVIVTEGIPGLWRFIKDKLTDLKSMVLDAIFDFIQEKVIVAGITWVIGLLNPASAFFKACKAIYDIVMFFVNRGSQILALVNAVIDSIAAIAKGSIGVAATMVENALAKAIPVAIGFLASLLGLGDISGTIRKTIEKAQAPVNKAIDWVINGAVKVVKAAGNLVKGLVGGGKKKPATPEEKETSGDPKHDAQVDAGLEAVEAAELEVAPEGRPTREQAEDVLRRVRKDHPVFTGGSVVDGEDHWIYELTASSHKKHGRSLQRKAARMIKKLAAIEGVQGVDKLIKVLGSNLTDAQLNGYLFQAERTLHWHDKGVLRYVELEMHFTSAGRAEVSVFDIVIQDEDLEGKENSRSTLIFIDTKSWSEATRLGQVVQSAKSKVARDEARQALQMWVDRAAARLNKYRRLGIAVVVEWKGPVPDVIAQLRRPASAIVFGSIDITGVP